MTDIKEAEARFAVHPALGEAARAMARNMSAAGEADKALGGIFKDAGRYGVSFFAVYLHYSGGLTLPRLKNVTHLLSSPGRARAVLLYLRYLGFIARGVARPGEPQLFLPTQRCLDAWTKHLEAALRAYAVIEPAAQGLLDRFAEPEVVARFARIHAEILLSTMDVDAHKLQAPIFRVILHRNAGSQILWILLLSEDTDTFPPVRTRPLAIADIARRAGVSRTHVRRLLRDAAAEGLVTHGADDRVVFGENFQASLVDFYASQFAWLGLAVTAMAEPARQQSIAS